MLIRTLSVVLLSALLILAGPPAKADEQAVPDDIEKILALPEDKIDIGIAALTFAHDAFPDDTAIQAFSKKIDHLVEEVRALQADARARHMPGVSDGPIDTILATSEVIYNREGFTYDHASHSSHNALNEFLPGIIERKHGICTTMPMLYMAVAQRLGLQMYIVQTPQHNFLRVNDPTNTIRNFEATSNGTVSDERYIREENITPALIKSGAYMRPLTHHQYLAELLGINARLWRNRGQYDRAIAYEQRALEIDPQSPLPLLGIMQTYLSLSMKAEDDYIHSPQASTRKQAAVYLDKALFYRTKLTAIGFRPEDLAPAPPVDPKAIPVEVDADGKS